MGVLSCDRLGCNNIMCDILVPEVGYMCYECVSEFKQYAKSANPQTQGELIVLLKKFMGIRREDLDTTPVDIDQFFEEHRRDMTL